MTTITEFIEYLQALPEDTEISVITGYDCGYSTCTKEIDLDIDENTEFVDLTGNQFTKPESANYNKKYLTLGLLDR